MAGQISIKDSVVQGQIHKEMELQRLYGKKEATESHLSLCDDPAVCQELRKHLDLINQQIRSARSDP